MCLSNQSKVMQELKENHQSNNDIPKNDLCLEIPLPGFEATECTLGVYANIAEYLHEGDYVVYNGCDGRVTQVVNKYIQVTFTSGDLEGYEIIKHQEAWNELDFKFYFHKQVVDKYRKLYPNETDPKLINAILHNLKVKKAKAINDRYEKSKKEALKRLNREFKSTKIKKEL